jgi:hypothetical protein
MRQNTVDCYNSLLKGKPWNRTKTGAIHTDGKKILSYGVCIAAPVPGTDGHEWVLTTQRHSHTTTVQTNGIYCRLTADKKVVNLVSQAEVNKVASDPENWS